jgi:4-hydroxybenzoyl-CoA reductase subunit beta
MLRLPKFDLQTPERLEDAIALLALHGERAMIIAGGTDLLPNMKHELFTPELVVSLARIPELAAIRSEADGTLSIGAMVSLDHVATDHFLRESVPALAQAAGVVSGPQLRRMGTLGGNVMLDTRCRWYNQTHFWRSALGFCLKKDGSACHVVTGGQKCVAAASNDTAPALLSLGASLVFHGTSGRRELPIDELYKADGIYNKKIKGEILTEIRIPPRHRGHRGAYGKLRDRGSIDFPLFGAAVRLDLDDDGTIVDADLSAVVLQARPQRVRGVAEILRGVSIESKAFAAAVHEVSMKAQKQCHPLDNVPGDAQYRHAMVPVYVRRTLRAAAEGLGPVQHLDTQLPLESRA